ncbi:B12-binding domain-containing radical SAM protein [Arenibacterium sp. CAU 1754]
MPISPRGRSMRIALISPKGPLYRHSGGIFKKSLRYQPLTLTTLTALAPPEMDIEFTLIDEGIEDIPDTLQADLIGMTVITGTAPRAYELSARFRAAGIPVILGGPHVTLVPEEAAQNADAIVTGYAEQTWPQLLRDVAAGQMKPRYDQPSDFNLETPVVADRHRLNKRHYLTQAVFEATRACAHACEFCVSPAAYGRKQFQKPPAFVADEIRKVGARRNIFIDLNLISDRAYARELFTALIPLNVKWFGLVTSLIGRDVELMDLMAQSGCSGVLIGFETVGQAALKAMRKGFNDPDGYGPLVDALHKRGISIYGTFVFGLDEDDATVFDRTVEFCVSAGIDLPRFAIQTPFPGTPLYRRLEAEGRILTRDWELYDGQHVVFQPKGMSVQDLEDGHVHAWQTVYSAPNIARRLMKSRTQLPLAMLTNLGYRYYARHLDTHYTCDWMITQGNAA